MSIFILVFVLLQATCTPVLISNTVQSWKDLSILIDRAGSAWDIQATFFKNGVIVELGIRRSRNDY